MKKVFFIGAMMLCGMLIFSNSVEAQSKRDLRKAAKEDWKHEQEMKKIQQQKEKEAAQQRPAKQALGGTITVPCIDASKSDKEYYRQLGIGKDPDISVAMSNALQNANSLMYDRLGGAVRGLATDYSKKFSQSGAGDSKRGLIEREFTKVIDEVLNTADQACENSTQDETGNFYYYYVIQIQKGKVVDAMAKAIDQNAELRTEFDRDQFRKYAEEYMRKEQEFQNGQK